MAFIKTPLSVEDKGYLLERDVKDRVAMIDNLIELIVFTPRGSFSADPDFGFEYWNHEYSSINHRTFNNGQDGKSGNVVYNEITRMECQDSIRKSLETYESQLKQVEVSIELLSLGADLQQQKKTSSKYEVVVKVSGLLNDGLGIFTPYNKEIKFMMEPIAKRIKI